MDEETREENQNLLEDIQPVWTQLSGECSKTDQVWVKFSLKTSIVPSDFENPNDTWQASQAKDFSTCSNNSRLSRGAFLK